MDRVPTLTLDNLQHTVAQSGDAPCDACREVPCGMACEDTSPVVPHHVQGAEDIVSLARSVEALRLHPTRSDIVAARAVLDRLAVRIAAAEAEFDAAELWDLDGATSMKAWLVSECGVDRAAAARSVKVAHAVRLAPESVDAVDAGHLTMGQFTIVATALRDEHRRLFAEHAPTLLRTLGPLDIDATATAMRVWAERADALLHGSELPDELRSSLHHSRRLDGTAVVDATLSGDDHALFTEALRMARRPDDGEERRTRSQRDADALIDVCRHFLASANLPSTTLGRQRPTVNLVIDIARVDCATLTGSPASAALAGALTCDSTLRRVLTNGSEVLDFGRPLPTVPRGLRDAVAVRDRRCRFRGCNRGLDWCEIHHLHHRAHDGPDALANLVTLCARHHHVLHREGWQSSLDAQGNLSVTRPDGVSWTTVPGGP